MSAPISIALCGMPRIEQRELWERAIDFIALNDEPTDFDFKNVRNYTGVILVSEMLQVSQEKVARAVLRVRRAERRREQEFEKALLAGRPRRRRKR